MDDRYRRNRRLDRTTVDLLGTGPDGDGTDIDGFAPRRRPITASGLAAHEDTVITLVDAVNASNEAAHVVAATP